MIQYLLIWVTGLSTGLAIIKAVIYMSKSSFSEYLREGEGNLLLLENHKFIQEKFSDFILRPTGQQRVLISNIEMEECSVDDGTCVIRKGVTLRNVVIKDFSCGDALHISSEAEMENVKIIGSNKPAMVWIRRQSENEREPHSYENDCIALDISGYSGEVSITGIPAKFIKRNSEEHILINAGLLENVDWKELGFSPLSYWKLMAKKVAADKATEGIFSLPPKSGRNYERSMSELAVLKREGFIS